MEKQKELYRLYFFGFHSMFVLRMLCNWNGIFFAFLVWVQIYSLKICLNEIKMTREGFAFNRSFQFTLLEEYLILTDSFYLVQSKQSFGVQRTTKIFLIDLHYKTNDEPIRIGYFFVRV